MGQTFPMPYEKFERGMIGCISLGPDDFFLVLPGECIEEVLEASEYVVDDIQWFEEVKVQPELTDLLVALNTLQRDAAVIEFLSQVFEAGRRHGEFFACRDLQKGTKKKRETKT